MKLRNWLPFLLMFFVAGELFHLELFIFLPPAILVLILAATAWNRISLKSLTYTRKWFYRRGFPGEEVPLSIEIENNKPLPMLWLQAIDVWPRGLTPKNETAMLVSPKPSEGLLTFNLNLKGFAKAKLDHTILFRKRGFYKVGPARFVSGDIFSLVESEKEAAPEETVIVYPQIAHIQPINFRSQNLLGDVRARRKLIEDPNLPYGIRDYRPEDDFKHIHWNATARTGTLQTRVYQPVTARTLMMCLNVSTSEGVVGGFYPEVLDHLISLAASILYDSYQDMYSIGLLTNGGMVGGGRPMHIAPARTSHQLIKLFESLAALQPYTLAKFETYLIRQMHAIPFGSSLVILTAIMPDELLTALTRLRRYQQNITLVSTCERPIPILSGVTAIHLPYANQSAGQRVN